MTRQEVKMSFFKWLFNRKPKELTPDEKEQIYTKDFFDMILPPTISFKANYYIVGDSYRCAWVIHEYAPTTEEQAILSQLADRNGVTLRIFNRLVEPFEQRKILQNAERKNKLQSTGNNVSETIEAQGNLQDVTSLITNMQRSKEILLHCSVFIELKAKSKKKLRELQTDACKLGCEYVSVQLFRQDGSQWLLYRAR